VINRKELSVHIEHGKLASVDMDGATVAWGEAGYFGYGDKGGWDFFGGRRGRNTDLLPLRGDRGRDARGDRRDACPTITTLKPWFFLPGHVGDFLREADGWWFGLGHSQFRVAGWSRAGRGQVLPPGSDAS